MHLPIAARRLVDAAKTFARTIPAALPQWSRPFCQQHRSILTHFNALSTHSNAIQRFCCCRGRVRTILPLPARPPTVFPLPLPLCRKDCPIENGLTAWTPHRGAEPPKKPRLPNCLCRIARTALRAPALPSRSDCMASPNCPPILGLAFPLCPSTRHQTDAVRTQ